MPLRSCDNSKDHATEIMDQHTHTHTTHTKCHITSEDHTHMNARTQHPLIGLPHRCSHEGTVKKHNTLHQIALDLFLPSERPCSTVQITPCRVITGSPKAGHTPGTAEAEAAGEEAAGQDIRQWLLQASIFFLCFFAWGSSSSDKPGVDHSPVNLCERALQIQGTLAVPFCVISISVPRFLFQGLALHRVHKNDPDSPPSGASPLTGSNTSKHFRISG